MHNSLIIIHKEMVLIILSSGWRGCGSEYGGIVGGTEVAVSRVTGVKRKQYTATFTAYQNTQPWDAHIQHPL